MTASRPVRRVRIWKSGGSRERGKEGERKRERLREGERDGERDGQRERQRERDRERDRERERCSCLTHLEAAPAAVGAAAYGRFCPKNFLRNNCNAKSFLASNRHHKNCLTDIFVFSDFPSRKINI